MKKSNFLKSLFEVLWIIFVIFLIIYWKTIFNNWTSIFFNLKNYKWLHEIFDNNYNDIDLEKMEVLKWTKEIDLTVDNENKHIKLDNTKLYRIDLIDWFSKLSWNIESKWNHIKWTSMEYWTIVKDRYNWYFNINWYNPKFNIFTPLYRFINIESLNFSQYKCFYVWLATYDELTQTPENLECLYIPTYLTYMNGNNWYPYSIVSFYWDELKISITEIR